MGKRLALLKPDHLGDLVLAVPAIRALSTHFETALFVHPQGLPLAGKLFPGLPVEILAFRHLEKNPEKARSLPEFPSLPDPGRFDEAVCLRGDPALHRTCEQAGLPFRTCPSNDRQHETVLQQEGVRELVGEYDRSQLFFQGRERVFPVNPRRVGLCPSTGFECNAWPLLYWRDLGLQLLREGCQISLIGGPRELAKLEMLRRLLQLPARDIWTGDRDFGIIDRMRELDLVVASDSGTAHICSLSAPILSIWGPSPYRRFAPFGRHNRLLSLDLICSPCWQFHPQVINLCSTRQCLSWLRPELVGQAIRLADRSPGIFPLDAPLGRLFQGIALLPPDTAWPAPVSLMY